MKRGPKFVATLVSIALVAVTVAGKLRDMFGRRGVV